ncbi:MAG: threonine synthase [SAR324 cluster bacterium]|nr:threonine synthase [SAR324 cluster bacterium]
MKYISTRGGVAPQSFSNVVLEGLARDGGLYLPETTPDFSSKLDSLKSLNYQDLAVEIFTPFVEDCMSKGELKALVYKSYESFTDTAITPLVKVNDIHVLELFHGPTFAFKDLALQFLGNLFEHFLTKEGRKLNILGATSGDTGSAAIYGVRGKAGIDIFMLHPEGRVSPVQERQMTTVTDANVHNIAVKGTFDDCQALVKSCFNDLEFRDQYKLGAVNSINWARVLAQISYYFFAYFRFLEKNPGKTPRFSVPTGNFGDIFAGYMAKSMGLPMGKLILATNSNDILSRAVINGDYSTKDVTATYSPSMDIQLASNFERYLFFLLNKDGKELSSRMEAFGKTGTLPLSDEEKAKIKLNFDGCAVSEEETLATIKAHHEKGYLLDPHSAIGICAAKNLKAENPICLATAHPAKFVDAVVKATGAEPPKPEAIAALSGCETRLAKSDATVTAIQGILKDTLA